MSKKRMIFRAECTSGCRPSYVRYARKSPSNLNSKSAQKQLASIEQAIVRLGRCWRLVAEYVDA